MAAVCNSVSTKKTTSEFVREVIDHGASAGSSTLSTPLKVPEVWVKGVRPNHPGLQEDIKNGSTLAAKYQTAEVQEIVDEEENPEPGLKSPFGKRRKSGALNL